MFKFYSKEGCGACEAVKKSTLSKFIEGVDYEVFMINEESDWENYGIYAVPTFRSACGSFEAVGLLGPRQLAKKLKEWGNE